MISSIISPALATGSVTAAAVVGLIIFMVTRELAESSEKTLAISLGRNLTVFTTSLLLLFLFIVVIESVRVVTD